MSEGEVSWVIVENISSCTRAITELQTEEAGTKVHRRGLGRSNISLRILKMYWIRCLTTSSYSSTFREPCSQKPWESRSGTILLGQKLKDAVFFLPHDLSAPLPVSASNFLKPLLKLFLFFLREKEHLSLVPPCQLLFHFSLMIGCEERGIVSINPEIMTVPLGTTLLIFSSTAG